MTSVQAVTRTAAPATERRVLDRLFAPVDVMALVWFRIAFGLIVTWEVYRYFDRGWIDRYWVEPAVRFSYYGFGWLERLPQTGMYLLWAGLGICGIAITVGFAQRIAAALFCLGFTYSFLLEATRYLNHFYLIALLSALLAVVPASQRLSLHAWSRPRSRRDTAPAWTLWLLRFQVGCVYLFGGVSKLNGDWLRGEPLRTWLARRTDFPLLGRWFLSDEVVYLFTYGGLLLDLLAVPALLWRRSRPFALVALLTFNVLNDQLFTIGVFPYLAFAGALLYLDPATPRRLMGGPVPLRPRPPDDPAPRGTRRAVLLAALGVYVAFQLLVPLRHYAYAGLPNWTEQGHQFAWHMKARSKSGTATFLASDGVTGEQRAVDPATVLEPWQVDKVAIRPELIRQFSHHVAATLTDEGWRDVEVRADVWATLNGRAPQRLIDPDVDLAAEPPRLTGQAWILPLTEPLPHR